LQFGSFKAIFFPQVWLSSGNTRPPYIFPVWSQIFGNEFFFNEWPLVEQVIHHEHVSLNHGPKLRVFPDYP